MRLLLVLLLVPGAGASAADALAWLEDAPPSGDLVEAIAGAGEDALWWPDGSGPLGDWVLPREPTTRQLFAVAASGYGSTWPLRADAPGARDLVAEARGMVPDALATAGIGDDAFLMLALAHWGQDEPRLVAALQAAQQHDGGWTCFGPTSTDCTGFALAALAAAGAFPADPAAAQGFLEERIGADGVRSDDAQLARPNVNSAAWAVHGLAALGVERPDVVAWIAARQTPEGGIAYADAADGPDLRATLEALPVLAGRTLPWPQTVAVQVTAAREPGGIRLAIAGVDEATWRVGDRIAAGTDVTVALEPGVHRVFVHGLSDAGHARAFLDVAPGARSIGLGGGALVVLALLVGCRP